MKPNKNSLEDTFSDVLKKANLSTLRKGVDLSGTFADAVFFAGNPIISGIIGFIDFRSSFQKYNMERKLTSFLLGIEHIPLKQREKIITKINSSKKYQISIGERILELLDSIEAEGKPAISGRIFAKVCSGEIDFEMCLRAWYLVKYNFYFDLVKLKDSTINNDSDLYHTDALLISGIINAPDYSKILDEDYNKKEHLKYTLTEIGDLIINHGMSIGKVQPFEKGKAPNTKIF